MSAIDWDRDTRLAREAALERTRELNKKVAEQFRDLAYLLTAMADALDEDDGIMGAIAGEGLANHLPALPQHIRHVFLEYCSDEAARSYRADRLYIQADAEESASLKKAGDH